MPFASADLMNADGKSARLAASLGTRPDSPLAPLVVGPEHTEVWAALSGGHEVAWNGLTSRYPGSQVPLSDGMGDEQANEALVLPMTGGADHPVGVLVLGVSPYLRLTEDYRVPPAGRRAVSGAIAEVRSDE